MADYIVTFDAYAPTLLNRLGTSLASGKDFGSEINHEKSCLSSFNSTALFCPQYKLLAEIHHAHFRYDYDDAYAKKKVYIMVMV